MLRPSSLRLLRCLLVLFILGQPLAAWAARTILVFGDSLSAGYGIRQEAAWPSLLAKRLQEKHPDYTVVNASISGETSSGGRSRLPAALERHGPAIVIIALGSNDGLRGLPLATLRDNLLAMIDAAQKAKARVLLVGQRLPPNYGRYADEFAQTFTDIAKQRRLAAVDFLLEGIATRRELFQADALHPTAEAQPILMESVWKRLEPLLK
ncbi:arylesterase [Propionivibrio dicarboxylicus]|uniref:Acyl-CoA thioesterase-1 n=1 Tax=Propionivibrio dicarboxylicus TaxID=83767 RepID=A0A1G8C6M4_9RHOO|nr:arylesterase [Propionivibrio dicarboxylicus]SDH40570.1 acyl-CoA thioesterase-1 [Propionivibrio dicarboxylicus]